MADPLSAAANVVAVIVVSIQSCAYLVEFFHKLADAPAEVRHSAMWLKALQSTFGELQTLAQDQRFIDFRTQLPAGFDARLGDCRADLQMVEARIRRVCTGLRGGKVLHTWTKVKHCFAGEHWSVQFSRRLQMYHSTFAIDLATIQIKLTILYNSNSGPRNNEPQVDAIAARLCEGAGASCVQDTRLARFLESCTEPVSVRVSTWYCLLTCLGSVAIWSGPVWQRRWANAQPEYTIVPGAGTGESGFGCQAFIGWGKQRRAVSLSCTWSCHSPLGGLFSMRWSGRFPNIVPACADIFDFVRTGNLAAVQLMFGTGKATPWDTSVDGRGLLHVAASSGCVEMTAFLLGQGADANSKDEEGRTPLHIAVACSGDYDCARTLLEHGADIGNRDVDGKTPLHVLFGPVAGAILTRHHEAVKEEAETRDASGMTILQYASWSSKSEPQHLNPYLQGCQAYTCIVRDDTGRTLLHLAAQRGNRALLRYLLSLPANAGLGARDASGQSVLHYAVYSKRTETIDLLLAKGADPHVVDLKGRTLLHCAAKRNNVAAVRRLLEIFGDRDIKACDIDNMTPGALAYRHKSFDAASLLGFSAPADPSPNCRGSTQPAMRTKEAMGMMHLYRAWYNLVLLKCWMVPSLGLFWFLLMLRTTGA